MTRTTCMLAFLFVALFTPQATAQTITDPRIRAIDHELRDALTDGVRVSPTLRRLVEELEASDLVIYLKFDRAPTRNASGHIAFLTATAGRRYFQISIDRRNMGCQRIAIVGHELQHALEIADEPLVVDEASLAALYQRIGFKSGGYSEERFDSDLAIATGKLIQREVLTRYAEFTSR